MIVNMNTQEILQWRYATKKFDTSKELPADDLEYILEAGNLTATSYGLQPFGIVVVTDQDKKNALKEAAFGQEHVAQNAALLVLCARTDVDAAFITEYVRRAESVRNMEAGSLKGFEDTVIGDITNRDERDVLTWCQKQAYIALGSMMIAAGEKMVDGCPMEGFAPAQFNEILGLKEHNLHASALLAIGYRSPEDETQNYKKVRRDLENTVVRI